MNDIKKLINLKKSAGSHSPSIKEIEKTLGYNPVRHDFCFLSNPYATELLIQELENKIDLFKLLEQYPASNSYVAKNISLLEELPHENIVVGNGAIECITWLAQQSHDRTLLIPLPTFSTYYEYFDNYKYSNKTLKTADDYLNEAEVNKCDDILVIYPNNPDGNYLPLDELVKLINGTDKRIIIDESFSHFLPNYKEYRKAISKTKRENFVLIKSMSKDFGIAGVRLGYIYTQNNNLKQILKKYTTWNVNTLAVQISDVFAKENFKEEYENVRELYNSERDAFYLQLCKFKNLSVRKSGANFFLLTSKIFTEEFVFKLLVKYGLYVRTMSDKKGLGENSIRVASRKSCENQKIIKMLEIELNEKVSN